MAKKSYIGVSNVARKVKKIYVGIGGVARKVKKAYIGIAGVARCFFSGGELRYYGTTTIGLSPSRGQLAATTVGNYALFGGGRAGSSSKYSSNAVGAYNASLTGSTPTALSVARGYLAATTVGSYALFGGGGTGSNSTTVNSTVDAYNTSLTRTNPTALSSASYKLGATTVGNYAIFGQGQSGLVATSTVDAYNASLTKSSVWAGLADPIATNAATTIGDYALFGGGYLKYSSGKNVPTDVVLAFNKSLTESIPTQRLRAAKQDLAATAVGNYALFGGGSGETGYNVTITNYRTVDAYNASLTKSTPANLVTAKVLLAATTVGEYALFGGGSAPAVGASKTVDAYNASLTKSTPANFYLGKSMLAATAVGNYALFGGGVDTNDNFMWTVDAYTVD